MAIFAEVTENERIIERHLCDIHPLLDYEFMTRLKASLYALSLIEMGLVSVRLISFQYYAAVARSVCDS